MRRVTEFLLAGVFLLVGNVSAQNTEYVFNPERTGQLTDAFPVYEHNGARGLSGPWDLDRDGKLEVLVAQHDAAGGTIHVIENVGPNTWELVYSTALIDSSSSVNNARYATAGDADGDGNWEIMFVAGTGYKAPWKTGVYVWEHDGVVGSDNYGTYPATVAEFYELDTDPNVTNGSAYSQLFHVADVDNDGQQEVLVAANGANSRDVFYILSVVGDFQTNGFGTTFETWVIEAREAPRTRNIGGGSPWSIIPADLNGDGRMDLSFHSWNNFNFFNYTTGGPDNYAAPADTWNLKASVNDDVALFGGVAGDIDGDGNDEIFYPDFQTGNTSVMDYDSNDSIIDILRVTTDNFAWEAIPLGGTGGAAFGDADQDGAMEIMVGGPGYSLGDFETGAPSNFIHIAEFNGGDPKLGSNYTIYNVDTSSPIDTLGFHTIFQDSLGVMKKYFELAQSKQGSTITASDPVFTSGIAFLGDADGDGDTEIALSFQGVDDSLYVYDEVWNVDSTRFDRTIRERFANPTRAFLRIISIDKGMKISTEENRIVLPTDYVLEQNYPNPFNPSTTIRFTLPLDKSISIRVYDLTGRLVNTVVNSQFFSRGTYEVSWDGTNEAGLRVASGTYLYTLEYGNFRQAKTMILLK